MDSVLYGWAEKPSPVPGELYIPQPSLVHFAGMSQAGAVTNWLWLFENPSEAIRLRLLPAYARPHAQANQDELDMIEATLTPELFVQVIDREWIREAPLEALGISGIWLGFDVEAYKAHWTITRSVRSVYDPAEFARAMRR